MWKHIMYLVGLPYVIPSLVANAMEPFMDILTHLGCIYYADKYLHVWNTGISISSKHFWANTCVCLFFKSVNVENGDIKICETVIFIEL